MQRLALVLLLAAVTAGQAPAQRRTIVAPNRTLTLTAPAPTGPAPAGLAAAASPMVARLSWSPATGLASYILWRVDGPSANPIQRTPDGFLGTAFTDTVPDPRVSYGYRLYVSYANGTWGEASLSFVSPPATNPPSLSVRRLGPDRFGLSWPAVAGAAEYRVDGPPIAVAGLSVKGLATTVTNVPGGPQTWQVVALFPGGFADYNNPTRASAVSRPLPPHPMFIVKNNGTGSERMAEHHARQACQLRPFKVGCPPISFSWDGDVGPTNGQILATYDLAAGQAEEPPPGEVTYTNVTELGAERTTNCFETQGQTDQFTICYTTRGGDMSMIIKGTRGGSRFLSFSGTSYVSWKSRWSLVSSKSFDAERGKYTPHNCLSCHGGVYDPGSGLVQGATLLPIDPGLVQLANRPAQEEPIRRINEMILRASPSAPVAAYIQGLYGGQAIVAGAPAAPNFVPPGWAADANFYLGVVKKDCQMCHLTTRPGLDFLSAGNFRANKALVYAAVCLAKSMPHAEVPYRHFWQQDTGPLYVPGLLATWLGYPSCQ